MTFEEKLQELSTHLESCKNVKTAVILPSVHMPNEIDLVLIYKNGCSETVHASDSVDSIVDYINNRVNAQNETKEMANVDTLIEVLRTGTKTEKALARTDLQVITVAAIKAEEKERSTN